MKVLKDNYNERAFECENCESELLVHKDDVFIDDNGDPYFTCPLCGETNYVELFGIRYEDDEDYCIWRHTRKKNLEGHHKD